MAITKIIAIRDRLDKRVNYAANGDKTSLNAGIEYAVDSDKTEQPQFVTTLNCSNAATVYAEMQATKSRFGKKGGVVGYHFIQSFAPGEVTPEQAHAIGVAFAQRLFGERYEVVVGTHLDKLMMVVHHCQWYKVGAMKSGPVFIISHNKNASLICCIVVGTSTIQRIKKAFPFKVRNYFGNIRVTL